METVTQETTAAEAVAGIASNIATVQHEVAAFDKVAAGLAELEKLHPKDVIIGAINTTAGMKAAVAARAAWRTPRLAVEAARKSAKAPVLALGKAIDAFAADLSEKLREGEDHYDAQIKAEEQRKEAEKAAKAAAEAARVKRHQDRIATVREALVAAAAKNSAGIAELIQAVQDVDNSVHACEEYAEATRQAQDEVVEKLRTMHAAAVEHEAEAARLAAEREELARLRAEQAKRDAEAAAARAEEERKAREAQEAAARAERERLAAERAAQEEQLRREREAHEAEMKAQREALAEQERQAAARRAEEERIAREAREAEERRQLAEREEALRKEREAAEARQREEEARAAAVKRVQGAAEDYCAATDALQGLLMDPGKPAETFLSDLRSLGAKELKVPAHLLLRLFEVHAKACGAAA